ncbi:dienelactone hydrolase family protein [Saccharomonospora sp. NPDC046836]|uniref:dienelactone hydrolase family protein n=1 Tax=Saccharomonospora sp. NPDC046836 TaxID=3156921 RepID=UPI0033D119EA
MSDIDLVTGYGHMPTYVATPSGAGPWPGVVVVHDFTGMTRDLRAHADWLAGNGFLAAAPDLYYWGGRLRCLRAIMRELGARQGRTFDDIETVRAWLRTHSACTGRIGVLGFCVGGGYAVLLSGHDLSTPGVFRGGLPAHAHPALAGACPTGCGFGGRDRIAGARPVDQLQRILTELSAERDLTIYPGAGTGNAPLLSVLAQLRYPLRQRAAPR